MKICILVAGLLFASLAAMAEDEAKAPDLWQPLFPEFHAVFFGHNISQTSYILPSGECTLGLQILSCGLPWSTSLATSPWLIRDYKMNNIFIRTRIDETSRSQTALQFAYFKTFGAEPTASSYDFNDNPTFTPGMLGYQMEAVWLQWIRSFKGEENFVHHVNVTVQHYMDDRRPFSLRRPSMRDHKTQLNLSDLLEIRLGHSSSLGAELGFLDIFGRYIHIHTGFSIQWRSKYWMAHLGYSMNSTVEAFTSAQRIDLQQTIYQNYRTYEDEIPADLEKIDYGIHPEFSLQYYF